MKNKSFYLKIFSFLEVKFSIYLNRCVFVMENLCCRYSVEALWWSTSNEYPPHRSSWRIKKNITIFQLPYLELWAVLLYSFSCITFFKLAPIYLLQPDRFPRPAWLPQNPSPTPGGYPPPQTSQPPFSGKVCCITQKLAWHDLSSVDFGRITKIFVPRKSFSHSLCWNVTV